MHPRTRDRRTVKRVRYAVTEWAIIEAAASEEGTYPSTYVRDASVRAARCVIRRGGETRTTDEPEPVSRPHRDLAPPQGPDQPDAMPSSLEDGPLRNAPSGTEVGPEPAGARPEPPPQEHQLDVAAVAEEGR